MIESKPRTPDDHGPGGYLFAYHVDLDRTFLDDEGTAACFSLNQDEATWLEGPFPMRVAEDHYRWFRVAALWSVLVDGVPRRSPLVMVGPTVRSEQGIPPIS